MGLCEPCRNSFYIPQPCKAGGVGSIPAVLLEDVIIEFDKLGVHAVHDPVSGPSDCAHDLVNELRLHIDDAFEILARQS